MTMGDDERLGCPYCGSSLSDRNVCPRCGTICDRCGTPYKTRSCPECGSPSSASVPSSSSSFSPEAPENTTFGEVAPELRETRGIFDLSDRKWISRREWNMMKGTFATSDGKQVHDRALAAVAQLGRSEQVQAKLLERAEQVAKSLLKRFNSVEKAVMYAVSKEAQAMGIPVVSVQNALGKAGFGIKFGSILVKVWTPADGKGAVDAIVAKVNGEARTVKAKESSDEEDERLRIAFRMGTLCKVRVPLLLTDSLSSTKAGEVVLDFGRGSEIVSFEKSFGARQVGSSTLRLQLKPEKAFGLFKVKKQVIALTSDQGALVPSSNADQTGSVDMYARRFLPSKFFPVSAELLRRAGCLGTVEGRFTDLFRERVKVANGRMPVRIARRALFDADMEAFHLLPPVNRRIVRLFVAGMELSPEDRRYTGVLGLLVPSEVGGRPL